MTDAETRKSLDEAFELAILNEEKDIVSSIPTQLLQRIKDWQFGKYGWMSPVNLIVTAAWYKWLNPKQDVCRIWSDLNGSPIEGGFSIRTQDEKFTVPLVTKKNIFHNFCSPNSGMQGTRALEKIRNLKRISRTSTIDQRVTFDLQLFKDIMNDINECSTAQAKGVFMYLMRLAHNIQKTREAELIALSGAGSASTRNELSVVSEFLNTVSDPQFVKCVGLVILAKLMDGMFGKDKLALRGVDGHKTASDARALTPGDFWFEKDGVPFIGVEIKDITKSIGFDVLSAVRNRKKNNDSLEFYFLISAAAQPVKDHVREDKDWQKALTEIRESGLSITAIGLQDAYFMARLVLNGDIDLVSKVSAMLPQISSLKQDTIVKWIEHLSE